MWIKRQKLVVLYGARQTGKTSLLNSITNELPYKTVRVNADQARYQEVFSGQDLKKMQDLVDGYELLFIDEGQKIPDLGIHLKILHDELPSLRVIVTGSSSFDLATKLGEPMTGRKRVYTLFPLSQEEMGSYPEVLTQSNRDERFEALREISESYLMKDIIEISQIRHIQKTGVGMTPISIHPAPVFIKLLEMDLLPDIDDETLPDSWTNFYRQDDWSAAAYFYLDKPESKLPDIASVEERIEGLTTN